MNQTSKGLSERDMAQSIRSAYNQMDASLTVNGFIVGKVGHKVTRTLNTTSVPNDSELYSFFDNATLLYTIKIVYTDATQQTMLSAERTA